MKSFGFLVVGFLAGFLTAGLVAKAKETPCLDSSESISDQISEKLDILERNLSTA